MAGTENEYIEVQCSYCTHKDSPAGILFGKPCYVCAGTGFVKEKVLPQTQSGLSRSDCLLYKLPDSDYQRFCNAVLLALAVEDRPRWDALGLKEKKNGFAQYMYMYANEKWKLLKTPRAKDRPQTRRLERRSPRGCRWS
jgi:hypothetical protein